MKIHPRHRVFWISVAASAAVLIGGFGVLMVFWELGEQTIRPGFPDYLSGTLGDAILLPAIVYVSTRLYLRCRTTSPQLLPKPIGQLVLAIAGFIAGAAVQISWLADDNPQINWTTPEPHVFSVAGWWHAIFLCTTSAAIAWLVVTTIIVSVRTRRNTRSVSEPEDRRLAYLLGYFGTFFLGLVVADSAFARLTMSSLSTIAASALVAASSIGVVVAITGPHPKGRLLATLCVLAGVASTVVLNDIDFSSRWIVLMTLTAMVGIGIAASFDLRYPALPVYLWLPSLLCSGLVVTGYVNGLAWLVGVSCLISAAAILTALALRPWPKKGDRLQLLGIGASSLSVTLFNSYSLRPSPVEEPTLTQLIIPVLASAVFDGIFLLVVQNVWAEYVDIQEKGELRDEERRPSSNQTRAALVTYVAGIGVGLGLLGTLLVFATTGIDFARDAGASIFSQYTTYFSALGAACLAGIVASWYQLKRSITTASREIDPKAIRAHRFVAQTGLLVVTLIILITAVVRVDISGISTWVLAIVGVQLLLLFLDTWESLVINASYLNEDRPDPVDHLLGFTVGLTTCLALVVPLIAGPLDGRAGLVDSLIFFVVAAFIRCALVLSTGAALFSRRQRVSKTDYPPFYNFLQDEGLRLVLLFLVMWMPAYFVVNPGSGVYETPLGVQGLLLVIYIPLTPAFLWACGENMAHFSAQRKLRLGREDDRVTDRSVRGVLRILRTSLVAIPRAQSNDDLFVAGLGFHLSFQVLARSLFALTAVATLWSFSTVWLKRALQGEEFYAKSRLFR